MQWRISHNLVSSKRLLSFRFKKERWELVLKLEWKKGYQYDIEKFTFKTYSRQVQKNVKSYQIVTEIQQSRNCPFKKLMPLDFRDRENFTCWFSLCKKKKTESWKEHPCLIQTLTMSSKSMSKLTHLPDSGCVTTAMRHHNPVVDPTLQIREGEPSYRLRDINSHNLFSCQSMDIVRRKLILITTGT